MVQINVMSVGAPTLKRTCWLEMGRGSIGLDGRGCKKQGYEDQRCLVEWTVRVVCSR